MSSTSTPSSSKPTRKKRKGNEGQAIAVPASLVSLGKGDDLGSLQALSKEQLVLPSQVMGSSSSSSTTHAITVENSDKDTLPDVSKMTESEIRTLVKKIYTLEQELKKKRADMSELMTAQRNATFVVCAYLKHHDKKTITYNDMKYIVDTKSCKGRFSEKKLKESIAEIVDESTAQKIFENIDQKRGVVTVEKLRKRKITPFK